MFDHGLRLLLASLLALTLASANMGCPPCPPGDDLDTCCRSDADCDADCDDGVFCNGAELCYLGSCQAGEPPCGGPIGDDYCIEGLQGCGEPCYSDGDCDDGLFCNGVETCEACLCAPGNPPCSDPCEGEICDESADECLPFSLCFDDPDCDDGVFCNGEETCCECGLCESGEPPCGPAECELCDETSDLCITPPACTQDADCSDGLFCNGVETCEACFCAPGDPPCADDPCGGEFCDEADNECDVSSLCTADLDCDDGLFCNGVETCGGCEELCESCGFCNAGEPPCANCDEVSGCGGG